MAGQCRQELPAKLSLPHLSETVPRQRLLDSLGGIQERLIWISGPPGAGKTCLLADYVRRKSIPHFWYQLDPGDDDPAVLFPWLIRAATSLIDGPEMSLPRFGAEFLPGLRTFSRRFFEALCEALPKPIWLVFDDYHQIGEESRLHEVMAEAAEAIPDGVTLVIASRSDPPDAMARLQLHRRMANLGWPELRLTLDEAKAVAVRAYGGDRTDGIERIHELSDGWMAGLVLLLQRAVEGKQIGHHADQTALFSYFARELFDGISADDRRTLLLAAQTPSVTAAQFRRATGGALDLAPVERLAEANLFVTRSGGELKTCSFHPLFREFLLDRAVTDLAVEDLAEYRRRVADALIADEQIDEAIPLLLLLKDYDTAATLICEHAPLAMRSGRLITLTNWLRQIPASIQNPWIDFWRAQSMVMFDPAGARGELAAVTRSFIADGNAVGAYAAWGCAAESYMVCWDSYVGLTDWLQTFEEIQARMPLPDIPTVEVRVISGLLMATTWHRADFQGIDRWVARIWVMLHGGVDTATALVAAKHLLSWHMVRGEAARAQQLTDLMLSRIPSDDSLDVVALAQWKIFLSLYYWSIGNAKGCLAESDACEMLAARYGLDILKFHIGAQKVYAHILRDDCPAARRTIDLIRTYIDPRHALEEGHWYALAAVVTLMEGHNTLAAEHAARSIEIARSRAASLPENASDMILAQCQFECGDIEAGRKQIAKALEWSRKAGFHYMTYTHLLVDAYYRDRLGDSEHARQSLSEAFGLGRQRGIFYGGPTPPRLIRRLCALAIRHGIEVDYARKLTDILGLKPAPADRDLESWPWPIRIYTFGRFRILRDDSEIRGGGKGQKRPLELLKALLALGGVQVRGEVLIELVWPDASGENAKASFDTTIHRLRKLLGVEHAIIVEGGKVSINPELCWVDAWALETGMDRIGAILTRPAPGGTVNADCVAALQAELVTRYAGDFLASEDVDMPGVTRREYFRSQTAETLLRLGRFWQQRGRTDLARKAFAGALTVDPLLEDAYCGLIGLAVGERKYSEALSHYGRCVRILEAELGVEPAPATSALVDSICDRNKLQSGHE